MAAPEDLVIKVDPSFPFLFRFIFIQHINVFYSVFKKITNTNDAMPHIKILLYTIRR